MFNSLFRRAEATVDNAISTALMRVVVAIPFLLAAGFATAAASRYLNRVLGDEAGSLLLAAIFLVLGLAAWAASSPRPHSDTVPAETSASASSTAESSATPATAEDASALDPQLVRSALAAVGPLALPAVLRLVMRNLPLIAAVAAAGLVLSREQGDSRASSMQPAE